jgi:hypothetical protein
MRRRLASLACGVLAAGCLYEVSDFADGAAEGPGGPGGDGGPGGGGAVDGDSTFAEGGRGGPGGEGGAGCVDTIDVQPKAIFALDGNCLQGSPPDVALAGGKFGVAWCDQGVIDGGPADALKFGTLSPDGTIGAPVQVGAGEGPVTVAATADGFAVAGARVTAIHRYDTSGKETAPAIDLGGSPWHVLLTASTEGILVTTLTSSQAFQAQWLANGSSTLASPQTFPAVAGTPGCCVGRRWSGALGFDPPQFVLSWTRIGGTNANVERVSTTGVPSTDVRLIPGTGGTPMLVPYGDRVLLGDCESLTRVGPTGDSDGTTIGLPKENGACQVAAAGTNLRMVRVVGTSMRWYAIDPVTGGGPAMLEFGQNPTVSVGMAWDGRDGFGVFWDDGSAISYAHLKVCHDP